jgi:hypothetical protein
VTYKFRLRGDFLPNRVFGAQKYRHALRENGRICCFSENGGEKAKFDEYLSLYLKDNCSDGKVNVKNEINISYLVSHLSLQHVSKDFETEKTIWNSGGVMLSRWSYPGMTTLSATLYLLRSSRFLL